MKPAQEIRFLAGPQSRWEELKFTLRILVELIRGFRALHFVGPCVTFFGSARFTEDHEYYRRTRELASEVARLGFTIMTGGGPGLMEAANRGARDVGGRSVGCNIVMPAGQTPNRYLDNWVTIKHFFVRKILLVKYSYAFVVMPGGYGTMDEYFEALTLIQTKKIRNFPIVIFCSAYYTELEAQIIRMKTAGTIGEKDAGLYLITDSVEEVVELLREKCIRGFNLQPQKTRATRWLFEHGYRIRVPDAESAQEY